MEWALCTKHCYHFPDYALLMIKYLSCYSSYGRKEYLSSSTLNSPSPPKMKQSTKPPNSFYFPLCWNLCNNIKKQNKQEIPAFPINLFIWQLRKAFLIDQLISVVLFYFLCTARTQKKVKEKHIKLPLMSNALSKITCSTCLKLISCCFKSYIQSYDKAKSVARV